MNGIIFKLKYNLLAEKQKRIEISLFLKILNLYICM